MRRVLVVVGALDDLTKRNTLPAQALRDKAKVVFVRCVEDDHRAPWLGLRSGTLSSRVACLRELLSGREVLADDDIVKQLGRLGARGHRGLTV